MAYQICLSSFFIFKRCLKFCSGAEIIKFKEVWTVHQVNNKSKLSRTEIIHFFKLGFYENLNAGFVLHFRLNYIDSNILVFVQAVFMQNCSSLTVKLRKKFEIKDGVWKQINRERSCDCKFDYKVELVSGICSNPHRRWVFFPWQKIPIYLILITIFSTVMV